MEPIPAAALSLSGFRQGQDERAQGAALTSPEFLRPAGLTFGPFCGTLSVRGPFRSFGGCPKRGIHGRQENRLIFDQAVLFLRLFFRCVEAGAPPARPVFSSDAPRFKTGTRRRKARSACGAPAFHRCGRQMRITCLILSVSTIIRAPAGPFPPA